MADHDASSEALLDQDCRGRAAPRLGRLCQLWVMAVPDRLILSRVAAWGVSRLTAARTIRLIATLPSAQGLNTINPTITMTSATTRSSLPARSGHRATPAEQVV